MTKNERERVQDLCSRKAITGQNTLSEEVSSKARFEGRNG